MLKIAKQKLYKCLNLKKFLLLLQRNLNRLIFEDLRAVIIGIKSSSCYSND